MFFVGGPIHEFKIPMKYLFNSVILSIIWKSTSLSVHKPVDRGKTKNFLPMKLNDFTEGSDKWFIRNFVPIFDWMNQDGCSRQHLQGSQHVYGGTGGDVGHLEAGYVPVSGYSGWAGTGNQYSWWGRHCLRYFAVLCTRGTWLCSLNDKWCELV